MSQSLPLTVNAIYQAGSLKLEQPLGLPEGTKLQVTIVPVPETAALDEADTQIVREILEEDREVFEALGR